MTYWRLIGPYLVVFAFVAWLGMLAGIWMGKAQVAECEVTRIIERQECRDTAYHCKLIPHGHACHRKDMCEDDPKTCPWTTEELEARDNYYSDEPIVEIPDRPPAVQ